MTQNNMEVVCDRCAGTGHVSTYIGDGPCSNCDGAGRIDLPVIDFSSVIGSLRSWSGNPDMLASGEPVLAQAAEALTSAQAEIERLNQHEGSHYQHEALMWKARAEAAQKERDALREALKPSGNTKAAYIGEFQFPFTYYAPDEDGETVEVNVEVTIPWTSIKEVMAAIRARALQPLEPKND
jgi:hypothetical protein